MLSSSERRDADDDTDAVITGGETLADMASYWSEALAEDRPSQPSAIFPSGWAHSGALSHFWCSSVAGR